MIVARQGERRPSERARGTGTGVPHAGQGISQGYEYPALLRAQRVGTGGQMFLPPIRAQARTCLSGTKDLKAPGARPGPVPPCVTRHRGVLGEGNRKIPAAWGCEEEEGDSRHGAGWGREG